MRSAGVKDWELWAVWLLFLGLLVFLLSPHHHCTDPRTHKAVATKSGNKCDNNSGGGGQDTGADSNNVIQGNSARPPETGSGSDYTSPPRARVNRPARSNVNPGPGRVIIINPIEEPIDEGDGE